MTVHSIVLDTNIVLDLLIFNDARCNALRTALDDKTVHWIAQPQMRDELERVLTYTHLQPRMAFYKTTPALVLQQFDAGVTMVEPAPRAVYICKDADDQKFIDLAAQHRATLVSKDKAVLCMRKRLAGLQTTVVSQWADVTSAVEF